MYSKNLFDFFHYHIVNIYVCIFIPNNIYIYIKRDVKWRPYSNSKNGLADQPEKEIDVESINAGKVWRWTPSDRVLVS